MAYNAGDVEAKLTLDRSDFITGMRQSRAEAESFERDYTATLRLNNTGVLPQITAMQKRLTSLASRTYAPKIRVDPGQSIGQITKVQTGLNNIAKRTYNAKLRVDVGGSIGQVTTVRKALDTLVDKHVTVHVDVAQAYADIMRFRAAYRQILDDRVVNFDIQVNMAGALAELFALDRILTRLDGRQVKMKADADTAGAIANLGGLTLAHNAASNAADRHTRRLIVMGSTIVGVVAPAIGVLGALLLTLPTVALMAGAALGAVALGFDGIKQAASTLKPQVDALKASLNATWARELTPVFQELAAVFPTISAGLNGQAVALAGWARAFTSVITSAQGLQQLNAIFAGLNNFIGALTPSVTNMTQAFMTLGVVGTQNLWALSAALNSWTAGFNAMVQHAAATGLLASAFQQLGFVVGAILGLLNELFFFAMRAMSALGPNLTTAIVALTNAFRALSPTLITLGSWFLQLVTWALNLAGTLANQLGPALPYVIAGVVGLYLAIQTVQIAMKIWAGVMVLVNGVMAIWRAVTVAATIVQWGLNAALLANPIGLVVAAVLLLIAAIGALIFGIVKLVQNWDTVVKFLLDGWNSILAYAQRAIDAIVNFFAALPSRVGFAMGQLAATIVRFFIETVPAWFNGAMQWIGGLLEGLQNNWPQVLLWLATLPSQIGSFFAGAAIWLFQAGLDVIQGLINGLIQGAVAVYTWASQFVTSFVAGFKSALGIASPSTIFASIGADILNGLLVGLQAVWQSVVAWFTQASAFISGAFTVAFQTIYDVSVALFTATVNFLTTTVNNFVAFWQAVWGTVSAFFTTVWQQIQTTATVIWGAVQAFLTAGLNAFSAFWSAVWNGISAFFTAIWQAMQNFAVAIWNAMVAFWQSGLTGFSAFWSSIWTAISNFFTSIWQAIQNTAVTIWNAIANFLTAALNAFSGFWNAIWSAILAFFTATWQNIQNTGVAIWNAINAFFTGALNAFSAFWSAIWNAILAAFTTIWNNILATGQAIWNQLNGFFVSALNAFSSFWTNTWNAIRDAFGAAFGGIVNIATAIWNQVKGVFTAGINAIINGVNWPIDKINGLFSISIPKIPNVPALATGGMIADGKGGAVHGRGNSTNDRVITRLSRNEHVWSAREVRAAGGHEALRQMRAAVLNPNKTADSYSTQAQAADVKARQTRAAMAMQARQMAPQNLGSGTLSALKRLKLMERNPLLDDFGIPGLAPGGVRPHVAAASDEIERLFGRMPGGVGGLGARSGPSDHPRGLALDFMTLSNVALGERVANYGLANAGRLGVKYIIWRQRINSGSGWRMMENRGSPTANHMDHPHFSFHDRPGVGGAFAGGGAAGGGFMMDYGAIFDMMAGPLKAGGLAALKGLVPDQPPWMEQIGEGLYNKAWEGIKKKAVALMEAAMAFFGLGGGPGNPAIGAPGMGGGGAVERWRPLVLAALARQGQPAFLADRVLMQIRSESGGNPNAVNNWDINARRGTPSGGLLQTIAPTFARYRDPGLPNNMFDPFANINASIRYALARYGSLNAAYRGVGYDVGGMLPKGVSVVHNNTNQAEHMGVFTDDQWAALVNVGVNTDEIEKALAAISVDGGNGLGPELVEAIRALKSGSGTTNISTMLPQGTSVKQLVQELLFQKRHSERGVYT